MQLKEWCEQNGYAELARRCGVSRQTVWNWFGPFRIPPDRVVQIEKATEGQVRREEMRPELYS